MSSNPSTSQPSASEHVYELPADVPRIPGVTEPHLCILDAFRTAIAQRIVDVYPELALERVMDIRSEWFESLINFAGL
jgi:hypothetical protein